MMPGKLELKENKTVRGGVGVSLEKKSRDTQNLANKKKPKSESLADKNNGN